MRMSFPAILCARRCRRAAPRGSPTDRAGSQLRIQNLAKQGSWLQSRPNIIANLPDVHQPDHPRPFELPPKRLVVRRRLPTVRDIDAYQLELFPHRMDHGPHPRPLGARRDDARADRAFRGIKGGSATRRRTGICRRVVQFTGLGRLPLD